VSVCFNPDCPRPTNPDDARFCQACGRSLVLANRYQALRLLGAGGSGRTLLARDLTNDRATGLASGLAGRSSSPNSLCVLQQFWQTDSAAKRQAAVLQKMAQHPQVPKLLDYFSDAGSVGKSAGKSEAGQGEKLPDQVLPDQLLDQAVPQTAPDRTLHHQTLHYLVQEFIAGQTLEEQLAQRGPFSENQVRQLLADLLPVLRWLHSCEVIHGDIKPVNIIAPEPNSSQLPGQLPYVLVDFGTSQFLSQAGRAGLGRAELGRAEPLGNPGYAAPEQALGQATFASDLYSLGVVAVHLLTGLHPFDLYSVGEDRWVWRQFLIRPVSSELRRVLDRLLERSLDQRYKTATEVLQALRLEVAVRPVFPAEQPVAVPRLPSPQANWRSVRTLVGHQGEVIALAVSPDGQLLASGSTDKTIRLWDLTNGKLLQIWSARSFRFSEGHAGPVTALRFSPNSEVLVSSSTDGTIKQWDLVQDELFSTLPSHGWGVATLALSPVEPLLVSGSDDGLIQIWDLETERLLAHLVQLYEPITALVMDGKGETVWSSSGTSICQWDLGTDRLVRTLKGHSEGVSGLALSRDGCTLISSGGKVLKLWNLSTNEQQKVIAAHRDRIYGLAVHPTARLVASASEDSTVKLWDLWTGQRLATLSHPWGVRAVSFGPQGELISGIADETIRIWQNSAE
jgi:WD40 repeat protein